MKNFTLVEFLVALVFTLAVMTLVYSVVVAILMNIAAGFVIAALAHYLLTH
jgi:hypothetical protein